MLPGDRAAVVGRRVVRGHRAVVVAAVGVDELHAADGEARLVELLEDVDQVPGVPFVHDHLPGVGPAVEADVAHREQPQVVEAHRAPGRVVAAPGHPLPHVARYGPDGAAYAGSAAGPVSAGVSLVDPAAAAPSPGPGARSVHPRSARHFWIASVPAAPVRRRGGPPFGLICPGTQSSRTTLPSTICTRSTPVSGSLAVVPEEVAQAVADVGVVDHARAERDVGVGPDDHVGPGGGEGSGERALAAGRAAPALGAPVQVHRDDLAVRLGGPDGGQQPGVGAGDPGTGPVATFQIADSLSSGEASAASTATPTPLTEVSYGRNAWAGSAPTPITLTGLSAVGPEGVA